jgi:hypothetical protein
MSYDETHASRSRQAANRKHMEIEKVDKKKKKILLATTPSSCMFTKILSLHLFFFFA